MASALRLGLTGGIGSGKSTVATLWVKSGATLIDADVLSRAVTAAGGAAIPKIHEVFGPGLINAEGSLDRDAMRQLAFSDATARAQLEAIVHPLVGTAIEQAAQDAIDNGAQHLVFDIPLLVESAHWRRHLHRVMVVDCTTETQIQRVMQRNSLSRVQVEHIIAAQASRAQRLRAADVVMFNDGIFLDELALQVRQIAGQFGL
ncbi:MAG: dephospho-CoA kinase [Curvibacter sp.]|nr:MAG: dephospho-CoA kinase [Curvibacter sp.]